MHHCFDAEYPPVLIPPHCDSVLLYIGGPNASRVTPLDEMLRFQHLRQFPCYVPSFNRSALDQADEACDLALARGWHEGRAIIGDTEAVTDEIWWRAFAARVLTRKFLPVDYGSLSAVVNNGADVIWSAIWDHIPALQGGQEVEATQYANDVPWDGTKIDLSVVADRLFACGGVGPRK